MTAMKKSLQLVFAVFVEILKGQVSKSEANTFKPAQNDCAISLLFEHIHDQTDPRVLEHLLNTKTNSQDTCASHVFSRFSSPLVPSCFVRYPMTPQYKKLLALLINIQSTSTVEDALNHPFFNPMRKLDETQEVVHNQKKQLEHDVQDKTKTKKARSSTPYACFSNL